jgi:hypothetical protein
MDEPTKKCSACGMVKPVSRFYKSKKTDDGYAGTCRNCRKIADSKNPSKVKEYVVKNMWGLTGRDY